MKMVAILFLIFRCFSDVYSQTTQCLTLVVKVLPNTSNTTNYSVQTNQIISVIGWSPSFTPALSGNYFDGTPVSLNPNSNIQAPQTITGLTNIQLFMPAGNSSYYGWATFQITTPGNANVVSNYIPADAVVIPSSATGDVQIILESSTDLVNWVAANPGTYGASSATNRFFRVRAVHN